MKNFKNFGLMLDCSRNAVMNVETLKKLILYMEKMGYDSLQLYTEETYEVEQEPYFGYKRGRYSIKEIQEVDAFASNHHVTLIPCIQTLAHLKCIFRWQKYKSINDIDDILMIDDDKTYELIDHMFASLRKAYSTDLIHIGMDEAWQVGRGAYYNNHGDYNRFEILLRHLTKVTEIAKKYGFKPMIWGDMFIREAKEENFDFKSAKKDISKLADLVYWNYYTIKKEDYDADFDLYHKICDSTWFAGGFWCWSGFAPFNKYSQIASKAAIESCLDKKVKNVFFTLWGDNGAECSVFTLLPTMFYVSCIAKGIEDEEKIKELFFKKFHLSYDDCMLFDTPNNLKDNINVELANPCKYMFYNDPFLGLLDTRVKGNEKQKYHDIALKLRDASKRGKDLKYLFNYLASLCEALEYKADLGINTRKAYDLQDKKTLLALVDDYKEAIKRIKKFYVEFRNVWEKENKTYGFEVQDSRIGGLILRLENCYRRIIDYVNGKTNKIEELEEGLLDFNDKESDELANFNLFAENTTACPM